MKKTITFLSTRAAMMLLATMLLTLTAQTAWAQGVNYLDASGTQQTCSTYTTMTSSTTSWNSGWYVVSSSTTINDRISVSGTVNLILCNGATLTASNGIGVGSDATFNVYAQSEDEATMGALTATISNTLNNYCARIGGNNQTNFGSITINGGKITATGFSYAAGIGGGSGSNSGNITINGGIVVANAGDYSYSAGIGGGDSGYVNSITLNGGTISATGATKNGGAGIGTGSYAGSGTMTITITSGVKRIVATKGNSSDCIGKGSNATTAVNVVFKHNNNEVTGDAKNAVFYDTGEGASSRTIRGNVVNHSITISDNIKANVTANTTAAPEGETITLTVGTAVDVSTLKVNDGTNDLTLTDIGNRQYTFVMPNSDVTVTATAAATYSVTLPANMEIVSATNTADGDGKYISGTVVTFKVSFPAAATNVSDGTNTLTADGSGNYSVTIDNADITITATIQRSATIDLSDAPGNFTAINNDVLTGSTSHTVTIADGAGITLSGATIGGGIACAGTAEITLAGTNSVTGATDMAGIQVGGSGTTLTIKGNGSLTANGGNQSAGIGLSRAWNVDATGGDIVIEGGTITANGSVNVYGQWGAGIGTGVIFGGKTARLGNITIKGGTVTANGGSEANGIGTGYCYNGNTNEIGTVTITTGIDRVEASSISGTVVYKHEDNDVTTNASDYFTIAEDGSKRTITLREYTITYNLNGGTNATGNPATYNLKTETFTIADPSKDGYTFAGWFSDAEFNTAATTTITKGTTGEKTFWAKWSENIATLTEADPIAPLTAWSGQQTKVRFERTGLTAGKYSTICLPYNFTASETCTFYTFVGVKKEGDDWVADISAHTGTLEANTPYIFTTTTATSVTFFNDVVNAAASYSDADAKTTITDWTFQGTYSQISLPKTGEYDYGFAAGSNSNVQVGSFVHLKSGASAAPFRAYLKYTGSDANWAKAPNRAGAANDAMPSRIIVRIVGADGGTTDIGTLDTRTGEIIPTDGWFDLNGRRLQGKPSTKGVYINNGKKVVIK